MLSQTFQREACGVEAGQSAMPQRFLIKYRLYELEEIKQKCSRF